MAITFIKHARFDPKDVKNITFDIDQNWLAKELAFVSAKTDGDAEMIEYTLSLNHKKTNQDSKKMRITLKYYKNVRHMNEHYMEIHVRPEGDNYGYGYARHQIHQRNIYVLLRNAVKDIEFIKGMFLVRRMTQRETFKKFGKIFGYPQR